MSSSLTAREIVKELDRHIVGQIEAKKAVARAIRERWRRMQLSKNIREEIKPKNILMSGPTGVGKTEIARRLAKLTDAPFIKVEATKFTEVGYVGRDVEQIIRDMVEITIARNKEKKRKELEERVKDIVEDKIIIALRKEIDLEMKKLREGLRKGQYEENEIEIEVRDKASSGPIVFDNPSLGGVINLGNVNDMINKAVGEKTKLKKMKVAEARKYLIDQESENLIGQEKISDEVIFEVEEKGIVFIDEIDKICMKSGNAKGQDVSREGVQRDLLPLLEGTSVTTKHGNVKTDGILFIASGAFHASKPSDLLAELQGRLPIRVTMEHLDEKDFVRILTETKNNLLEQNIALLKTEGIEINFTQEGIEKIAAIANEMNNSVENIGARRLQTILEKVLEEVSFAGKENKEKKVLIDENYVKEKTAVIVQSKEDYSIL